MTTANGTHTTPGAAARAKRARFVEPDLSAKHTSGATASVYIGDCTASIPRIKACAEGTVDLVFADPPFNWNRDYDRHQARQHLEADDDHDAWHDAMEREDYIAFTHRWLDACRAALRYRRDHKGLRNTCYTSSMVALGRLPGDAREVLVFVVVEDARCKLKFGADVAGPSTIAILRAAHGLEARPAPLPEVADAGEEPALLPEDWFNARDFPWAEEEGGE